MSTNNSPVLPSTPGRGGRALGRSSAALVVSFLMLVTSVVGLFTTAYQFHLRNEDAEANLRELRALRPKPLDPERVVQETSTGHRKPILEDFQN